MRNMYDIQNPKRPEPDRYRLEKFLPDEEPCPDIPCLPIRQKDC